jgi:hypothetical protein
VKVTALLADAVAVAEGKLYVQGGGWHSVGIDGLPGSLQSLGVGILIDLGPDEMAKPLRFVMRLRDSRGRLVSLAGHANGGPPAGSGDGEIIAVLATAQAASDNALMASIAIAFNLRDVVLQETGLHELQIEIGGLVRERLPLVVTQVSAREGES